jgi:hypothetical protein
MATRAGATKPPARRTPATPPPAKKPPARPPAAKQAAAKQAAAKKPAARKPPARKAPPRTSPPPSPAPVEAAPRADGPDPEGFFVARVRGEDAVREAPHQLQEAGGWDEEPHVAPLADEGLGELPWSYDDDLLVALPRDPSTLFLYWDHRRETVAAALAGIEGPRVQLRILARAGEGWELVRTLDCALESRGYYVHDLEPGRIYRAELHVVGGRGEDRLLPQASNPMGLPPVGPSPVVDDRFVRIPWDLPLGHLLGPGRPGGPFSEEVRALLARLSAWATYRAGLGQPQGIPTSGAGAEGAGAWSGGPSSPSGGPSSPTSPSSPFGPFGGGGGR